MKKKIRRQKMTKRVHNDVQVSENPETKKEVSHDHVKSAVYPGVFINTKYKTCLAYERKDGHTLALQILESGLQVIAIPDIVFVRDYRFCEEHLVQRCAAIYAEFMQYLGATDEAIEVIKTFTKLKESEITMAKAAKAKRTNPEVSPSSAKGKAKVEKEKKASVPKEQTASKMFQDLIMAGKLTDEQIFAKVKADFGLDDKKRGYVAWYRNHLKKQGKNPPEAIEAKK